MKHADTHVENYSCYIIKNDYICMNKSKMSRRVYFNTEKTVTVIKKGYIELDEDFTQVYKSFSSIALKIDNGISWKLLFYLLSEANNMNGVDVSAHCFKRFADFLEQNGANKISSATYYRCINELCKAGALTKYSKGHYYLNPYIFWQADKSSRVKFLQDEIADKVIQSVNPTKLLGE